MARGYRTMKIEDFSGGWNPRDAASQVADNESPDMLNVTLDERGGLVKRLGYSKYNSSQLGSDGIENFYYWQTGQYLIAQQGDTLYYSDGATGTWTTTTKTFTTSARVGFADFQGKLVVVHPVDGVFINSAQPPVTFTQTTGGTANMEAVRGNTVAVWQNKVWVGGDPNNKPRVWWSNPGNPALWTIATDWVDLRDKDDALVTAVGAGPGMDTQGRPGLIVFKDESCHRINNSTTGQYTTLDTAYGAAGPLAVTSALGGIFAISKKGVISVEAGSGEIALLSDKLRPLFTRENLALTLTSNMCAGQINNRCYFSLTRFGGTANDLTLEFDPQGGWFAPQSIGVSAFVTFTKNENKLMHASPTAGYVYNTFATGADDSAAIAARFQSRWFEPNGGHNSRFRKLVVDGRGSFTLYTKFDFDDSLSNSEAFVLGATQGYDPAYSLGYGRSISFEVQESSTTSGSGGRLLDDGPVPTVGAFALYGLTLDVIPLGTS